MPKQTVINHGNDGLGQPVTFFGEFPLRKVPTNILQLSIGVGVTNHKTLAVHSGTVVRDGLVQFCKLCEHISPVFPEHITNAHQSALLCSTGSQLQPD